MLARFYFVQRLTAILIALAICGAAVPRVDTVTPSREMTIVAAKACAVLTLFLPDSRVKSAVAGSWIKLNLIPVFSGKILDRTSQLASAIADQRTLFFAHTLPPRLVGTVELRI